jgi:signal peptidase I
MTTLSNPVPQPPWLTVWFSPRDTIERIVATDPKRHVLVLAVLGTISALMSELIDGGLMSTLLDWHVMTAVVLGGALLGIIYIYLSAALFRWSGAMLGGRASAVEMRAVVAWGLAPSVISLAICLAALGGLKLFGSALAPERAARMLIIVLQVIAGVLGLWSLIATMLMLARVQKFGFWRTIGSYVIGSILVSLVIAFPLMLRTFAFQPFNTPSGSMMPTFLIGDYIFVSKFSYGYSNYSLPYSLRLFSGRVLASEPQRGDVVVFRLPKNDKVDYVKRVVGLPGDRVQMIDGLLYINGEAVQRERLDDFIDTDEGGSPVHVKRWRETLANGRSYATLDLQDNGFYDNTQVYTVPPGHYFMMGDNRDNSTDSRVLSQVGYVPFENIIGRAEVIFFSIAQTSGRWQPTIRFERLGMAVK